MIKVVLDTNIFVSSIFWHGNPHKIIQKAIDKKIQVFITLEILDELEEVMRRDFSEPEDVIQRQINLILTYSTLVAPKDVGKIVKEDPEDDKILRCAARINADYIVSGDRHLLDLKNFRNAKIVSPREFVDMH